METTPQGKRLLRLFLSSTFRDMQKERDILARLVLPRQRAILAAAGTTLQEVDLRWGVTTAMSRDGGALAVCLREIAGCFPLVLGMLGRRSGWQPPREPLENFDSSFAQTVPPGASMTEIEMRYAVHLARRDPNQKLLLMLRSDRLSAEVALEDDGPATIEPFRRWALTSPAVEAVEYDSFEEFERRVDAELRRALAADLQRESSAAAVPILPVLPRIDDLRALAAAAGHARPTLVTGDPGVGCSWLVRRWASEDPHGVYLDGRDLAVSDFETALRSSDPADGSDVARQASRDLVRLHVIDDTDTRSRALIARMSRSPPARRIVLDHYEHGFASEERADLSWIPTRLPRGCSVVLVCRSKRLQTQATDLGWQLHAVKPLDTDEALRLAERYLEAFSKYLSAEQRELVRSAPWSGNVGSLLLALDELRRYGDFETLDDRLRKLAGCDSRVALAEALVAGLTSVMPPRWQRAVVDALLAIRMSIRGLEEDEIRAAVGFAADTPPQPGEASMLPSHLWSAIRISLRSSLAERGTLIDVAGGPLSEWVETRFPAKSADVQRTATGLTAALKQSDPVRRFTEMPRLAELRGSTEGLEQLLGEPSAVEGLVDVGETFAEGWLSRLSPPARRRVIRAWLSRLDTSAGRFAGSLGRLAARAGETELALRLLELDRGTRRGPGPGPSDTPVDESDVIIAFLRRDGPSLARLALHPLASNPAEASPAEIMTGLTVLAASAEKIAELDLKVERALVGWLESALRRRNEPLFDAQLQIYSGQLLLMRGKWFAAARKFAAAERAARRLGHARLLCRALERQAAVQLERNRFRAARHAAIECRELAFRAGLSELEALAFERQIEVERRTANWKDAYEVAEMFLRRCKDKKNSLCDVDRAKAALAALEVRG
jgi:hypothetical protein